MHNENLNLITSSHIPTYVTLVLPKGRAFQGLKVQHFYGLFTSNMLRGVPQSLLFKAPVVAVPLLPWENSLPRRGDHHKDASDEVNIYIYIYV